MPPSCSLCLSMYGAGCILCACVCEIDNWDVSLRCMRMQETNSKVQRNEAGAFEVEMPPPLPMTDLPPALASTLQHIVGKLDMMTQVIGMVEERLSLNEDKMAGIEARVAGIVDERLQAQEAQLGKLVTRLEQDRKPAAHSKWIDSKQRESPASEEDALLEAVYD